MALKIRLARGGAKSRPHYSIVVADSRMPRDGRFIEKVGTYDPLLDRENAQRVQCKDERIRYWLSVGARPTGRVARFLSDGGLFEWKRSDNPQKGKPGKKALERAARRAEKKEDMTPPASA